MNTLQKWVVTVLATAALVTVVMLFTGQGAAIAAKVDSVFVTNTPSNPVPVAQQVATKHVRELLETGAEEEFTFPEINASLLTIQGDTFGGIAQVIVRSKGTIVLATRLQPSERIVLPLAQLLPVDEVDLAGCSGRAICFAEFTAIGS